MEKEKLTNEEIEFLKQSNYIELEYSKQALEDAKKAWIFAKECKDSFTIESLIKIQNILAKNITPRYAGFIRTCPVYIGGECRDQSKEEIINELTKLFLQWKNMVSKLKKSKEYKQEEFIKNWHVAYEGVHPFCDFNGRTGRILMNLQRLKLQLPLLIIYNEKKQEYYKWFRKIR